MVALRGSTNSATGCNFDDPTHEVLGLTDTSIQDIYYFTVGRLIDDESLTTLPPYRDRSVPFGPDPADSLDMR
jgi:hypothetical protein